MNNHWDDIEVSLLRFCSDFKEEVAADGFELSVVNLDNFTDESEWPEGDFVGIGQVMTEILEAYEVKLMFAIATDGDKGLYRMRQLTKKILEKLIPNSNIPIYEADTGAQIGKFFVQNGVSVAPPVPTKTKPVRPIMVGLLTDLKSFG